MGPINNSFDWTACKPPDRGMYIRVRDLSSAPLCNIFRSVCLRDPRPEVGWKADYMFNSNVTGYLLFR